MEALLALTLAAGACFRPTDATPGWKQVALPPEAPALSAPAGVPQFRPGEPVTVTGAHPGAARASEGHRPGSTVFAFPVGPGAHELTVRFAHPLRGAAVDVDAWGPQGALPLWRAERVPGDALALRWGDAEVREVQVRVHQHLREPPVVRGWESVRVLPGEALVASAAFRLPRSLYYLQPRGPAVLLCDDPGRGLGVPEGEVPPEAATPVPVSLERP